MKTNKKINICSGGGYLKNNAFTLIELLAVIVILAIIALIATPVILGIINDAKEESRKRSIDNYVEALKQSILRKEMTTEVKNGKYTSTDGKTLTNGSTTLTVDYEGETVKCNTIKISKKGQIYLKECSVGGVEIDYEYPAKPVNNCTFDGELTVGAEYTNGQYTYIYKRGYSYSNNNIITIELPEDGWSVKLTTPESTEPVTTKLCTTVNNKPIVSMSGMFMNSAATTLDLSSFDTSNVTSMIGMFYTSQVTTLNLNSFDTSNVKNMAGMFAKSQVTTLDLSDFDTSNVEDMFGMFMNSAATTLDLSSFDTSNVTNMRGMFERSRVTTLNLRNWDTSKVTDMNGMFLNSAATTLDLSSFDTSNVTNMGGMFGDRTKGATIYARTQADIDRFNPNGRYDYYEFVFTLK